MKNRIAFATGILLLLWAVGLPSVSRAWFHAASEGASAQDQGKEEEPSKEMEAKACGPKDHGYSTDTDKKSHPTPDAPPDKAMIYVIRPTMGGNKVQTKLAVDGQWMGVNRGNNYFFFTLDPGEHYFCSQAENRSVLSLKVDPGKTYYLQQKVRFGFMKARNKLEVLDEAEGKKGLAKCHPSSWTEKK